MIDPDGAIGLAIWLGAATTSLATMWRSIAKTLRSRRALARERPKAIAETADGEVACIEGELAGDASLVAPLSGRACVAWRVQRFTEYGRLDGDRVEARAFFVVDASGRAIVRAPEPVLAVAPRRFVREHQRVDVVLEERAIAPGERVRVLGVALHELDDSSHAKPGTYREPPKRLVLQSSQTQPLVIARA